MPDKLMYIPNYNRHKITPSVDYNYSLKHFNTQLNKPTNQNSVKSPKLLSQQIRKCYDKLWELVLLTAHWSLSLRKTTN